MRQAIRQSYGWFCEEKSEGTKSQICATRDVFQARLDTLFHELSVKGMGESQASLLAAVAGEIGNNSFDHNLGQWQDAAGCWFQWGKEKKSVWVVIADRGQGIRSSLARVQPGLADDRQALEMAFEKRISGRSPERRGNGLKFVRGIVNGNPARGLVCVSGTAMLDLGGLGGELKEMLRPHYEKSNGRGTFTVVMWRPQDAG